MILPACADDAADHALIAAVRAALAAAAVPADAEPMRAYMKSALPFFGVKKPARAAALKPLYAAWQPVYAATWRSTVLALFRGATHREEWYAAVDLLLHRPFRPWLDPVCLELCETLIVESAWWDVVDPVSSAVQHLLVGWPDQVRPVLWAWASDEDLWRRRTAIICQLHRRGATDRALLAHAIDQSLAHPDFFVRKAIGWALRDLGDHDPDWVAAFVADRRDRLSPLSVREALRKQWAAGRAGELRPPGRPAAGR